MSYVFSDQLSKLSSLLGDSNTSTDDMFPLTLRKKEINRGEWQFAVDSLDLREYETGTVASSQIAIPSNWIKTYVLIVNNVVITNDREISLSDWERYYNYSSDRPYYYFWDFSGTRYIKFLGTNVNGLTYKLFYFKKPTTELSSDSDTSLHPEEYREASVYYAASELMKQIGKHEQSNLFRSMYEQLVLKARVITEQQYVNKEYARPDFGDSVEPPTSDVQGRGYIG